MYLVIFKMKNTKFFLILAVMLVFITVGGVSAEVMDDSLDDSASLSVSGVSSDSASLAISDNSSFIADSSSSDMSFSSYSANGVSSSKDDINAYSSIGGGENSLSSSNLNGKDSVSCYDDVNMFGDSVSSYDASSEVSSDAISTYGNDGRNIYVSTDGKDSNTGDVGSPLATIAHAVELANVTAGANIILGVGTFNAHGLFLGSGNFTLSGQGLGKTTIDIAKAGRFMEVGENTTLVVKDLLIINGEADATAVFYNAGNLTLISSVIANSRANSGAAGAISTNGPLYLINSTIVNCTASQWGGAIATYQPGAIYIYNSTIDNCKSDGWNGGSICSYTSLIAENSNFTNSYSGGMFGGGAIFLYGYTGDSVSNPVVVDINKCNFENTSAPSSSGGAIYSTVGTLSVTNSNFTNCTAKTGSIIYSDVPTTLTNNNFKDSIGSEILSISKGNKNITKNTYSNFTI